jgi:hypothetical protein
MSPLISSYPNLAQTTSTSGNPWGYDARWIADRKNKIIKILISEFGGGNLWVSMARFRRFVEQSMKVASISDCHVRDYPFSDKAGRAARMDQMINKSVKGEYAILYTIEWVAKQASIAENTARKYRLILEAIGCFRFAKQAPGSTISPPLLEGVDLPLLSIVGEVVETWLREYAGLTQDWNPAYDGSEPLTCTEKARAEIQESLKTQYCRDFFNRAFRNVAQFYRRWTDDIQEMLVDWHEGLIDFTIKILPCEKFADFKQNIGNVFWGKIAFPRIKRFYFMHSPA